MDNTDCSIGCLADTGFLYGVSDTQDRVYRPALEVFEIFEEKNIPIYTNVIGRMEFVDLVFRKLLTLGAVKTFSGMISQPAHKSLYDFLKKIRDEDTASRKSNQSYKIGENQLKRLRKKLEESVGEIGWKSFCAKHAGQMLLNEWKILEEDLGLHFIEALEGQTTELITIPLHWSDMVQTMGELGVRGPDAMIVNFFKSSALPLLITTDKDFNFSDIDDGLMPDKAVFILDEIKNSNLEII